MQIIIDGKEAVLKQGSSFDFIAENRLFSGSDSFTLTITFPLRDCPQNLEIFGLIHRSEIVPEDIIFDCEIRDKAFSRFGSLTITEISDIELKAQFLEGRAEQNFAKDFDETFVNELDLGSYPSGLPSEYSPDQAWDPATTNWKAVALPWVSADSGVAHNLAEFDESTGKYSWSEDVRTLSWQPYLLHIAHKICEAVGYTYDFTPWESDLYMARLLMCNTLPDGWDISSYARTLPHWTVAEFFEKLELFMRGEFSIDHRTRHISFRFSRDVIAGTPSVHIDTVVDEFSSSINAEGDKCEYMEAKAYRYADQSLAVWKYMSCDWFFKSWPEDRIVRYQDLYDLIQDNKGRLSYDTLGGNHRGQSASGNVGKVLFSSDNDMYFVLRNISRTEKGMDVTGSYMNYIYRRTIQPINEFGAYLPEGTQLEDADEIEFVPALVDYTEEKYGNVLFLSFSGYNESSSQTSSGVALDLNEKHEEFQKTGLQSMIESGEKESPTEYYDKICVGYYDGFHPQGKQPYPVVSEWVFDDNDIPSFEYGHSLRINDRHNSRWTPYFKVDRTRKVTFKFLADDIPNPRALFYIHGRRYICEKITATFTEDGMSQLLKGEFWPLLDD